MAETLFYHLEKRSLEDVLPGLIEKSLARGWRAVVKVESADRADALDSLLWTYSDGFLPHAQLGDGEAARQPVLITTEEGNPNAADILFLAGGASPPDWASAAANALTRIVLLFDGRDPSALQNARESWKAAKAAGHEVTYWKESPTGKWEKQG